MDHVAGIAYYCSQRDFRDMAPATVLIPKRLAPMLDELLDFWGRFDGTRPPVNIIPVEADVEIELRRNLYAIPFKTYHTQDSVGYTIVDRRYKLKEEFLQHPGHEIAKMRWPPVRSSRGSARRDTCWAASSKAPAAPIAVR